MFTTLALSTAVLLTGCAQNSTPNAEAETQEQVSNTQAQALHTTDTWAKAAEHGMSAAFGSLHNTGDQDLELESVTDPTGKNTIEIHDTQGQGTDAVMKKHEGALLIKPGEELILAPGSTHLMFMELKSPLVAAETSTLQLNFSDGSQQQVQFPIRNFTGANESYHGDEGGHEDHGDH